MKTTFKITAIIILVLAIGAGKSIRAEEKTKEYHEKWPAAGVETINISNKFGEVRFTNETGTDITIDVVVTVDGSSDKKTEEMLDKIRVSFSKTGNAVKAETSISNNYNFNGKMSIDYVINTPSNKNLVVSNRYGNTVVNKLTGTGDFDIQYGNINAVSLTGTSTKVSLAYGKGSIEETGNVETEISYSDMSFGKSGNMTFDTKYSKIDVDAAKEVQCDSKYDKFNFGDITSLNTTTKYSQIRIAKLSKSLQVDTGYGGIKVDNVDPAFESISITNSYGQISLGLSGASYNLDARCDYCGISYPAERYKGNRMKENTSIELQGKVGNASKANVVIKSRYGDIKLGD